MVAECLGGNTRQSCRLPSARYNALGKHKALGIFTVSRSEVRCANKKVAVLFLK